MTDSIRIIAAFKGWLAVDKPCGLSVHNDPGNDLISKLTDLIQSDKGLANNIGAETRFNAKPVHRLDKETSGVILIAVQPEILTELNRQFSDSRVKKIYKALVHGQIEYRSGRSDYDVWDFPLAKQAGGRKKPQGKGALVNCETRYRVIDNSRHYSLVRIELITGRKHQIRRHAKMAGHPVVGDTRYGSRRSIDYLKNKENFNRLGLHCQSIEIVDPLSKNNKTIKLRSSDPLTQMMNLFDKDKST